MTDIDPSKYGDPISAPPEKTAMDSAKGWKTLGFAALMAVAGVVQTFDWATVIPQDKTWSGVMMVGIGAAIAALRAVTTTSVGKSS